MISPWLGIALVLVVLVLLIAGTAGAITLMRMRGRDPHPEISRKVVHVGMGLVTLCFPWLFESAWPVVLLAGLAIAALFAIKYSKLLRRDLSRVLHGVERSSLGEIYFPIAVAAVFVLARGDTMLFCIPILILTLADAVAALIGMRYGRMHYEAGEGERKSAEGSIAFFTVAFLSAHVPLLLFTDLGRSETLLIALTLGVLVALFEAIAWRGLDNLFIPLGAFVLLKVYRQLEVADLAARFGVVIGLTLFTLWWRRRSTLSDSGALAAALAGYAFWALGAWLWLLPPVIVLLVYPFLAERATVGRIHGPRAVLGITVAGLVWVFVAKSLGRPELYYLFILSFAAQLAITTMLACKRSYPHWPVPTVITLAVIHGGSLMAIWWWQESLSLHALVQAALASIPIAMAVIAFYRLQRPLQDCPTDGPRWLRQGLIVFAASLLGALPLYLAKT